MGQGRRTAIFIIGFVLTGLLIGVFFPREEKKNPEALIRIGAGDDISGLLMEETVTGLRGKYQISDTMESTSFGDC